MMLIGALSRRAGVHIETIRYYERAGVLPPARRSKAGRRVYSEDDVRRLAFIRHARDFGFDLTSVRILLALQGNPDASCEEARRIAAAQLAAVDSRIARLLVLRDELVHMVEECRSNRVADCRVIAGLAEADLCGPHRIRSSVEGVDRR